MSAIRFTTENPDYFSRKLDLKQDWERIKEQAIEHTRYVTNSRNIDLARPNEPKAVKDYRNETQRRLTKSVVDKFKTKTSRIFRSSGLQVNEESLSSSLTEYLASKPYLYLNQPTDLMTYFFDYIYNQCIDDPNAVEIILPVNPDNPDTPPFLEESEGGVKKNEHVPIQPTIVQSDEIVAFTSEVFSWFGGYMFIENGTDTHTAYKWFWIVDKEYFYRYVPVRREQEKIIYELRLWYRHDTGFGSDKVLPVNILPGNLVFDEAGNFAYQASILAAFFEYADEFQSRFSDGQGVWITSAFPIHIMEEMACTAEGCFEGKVKLSKPDAGGKNWKACDTCLGTGHMQRPSPYGVLVRKDKGDLDSGKGGKPYELINPESAVLNTTYEIPFDLLKKGEKQIGLDVLENAIESGVSRAMRFEDVKDKLAEIASKLTSFLELHLYFTEALLTIERNQRKIPSVNTPVDFQLKSSIDLKEEAENALPSDRLEKTLAYYRNVYKNNERLLRVYELAFDYSPALLLNWEEAKDQFQMGIIDENDLVKRNHAIHTLREISTKAGFLKMTDENVFEQANKLLEKKGLLKSEKLLLTDDDGVSIGISQLQEKSALLSTVGGVEGIISLSAAVSAKTMTEDAAENILVEVYGFSSEVAKTLIQVPLNPNPNGDQTQNT